MFAVLFRSLISLLVCTCTISAMAGLGTATEVSALDAWIKWTEEIKERRQLPYANIYLDSTEKLDANKSVFLMRESHGEAINKLSSSLTKPSVSSENTTLLGQLVADPASATGFSFMSSDKVVASVNLGTLTPFETLGLAIWLFESNEELYVYFYNYQRPYADLYRNITFFAYDPQWVVNGEFQSNPTKLTTPASNGETWDEVRLGFISFSQQGIDYRVAVYESGDLSDPEAFVQVRFGDAGVDSYPGGRYLYVKVKELNSPNGVVLDFNRAFDPPCAWSQAYTCSLPRVDEFLETEVRAGAMYPLSKTY